jgi:hypothetical protein
MMPCTFWALSSVSVFFKRFSVSSQMMDMLIYPKTSLFVQVRIFPLTDGIISLSLVTSFSISSLVPFLATLSMVSFTFVHLGHLIWLTA